MIGGLMFGGAVILGVTAFIAVTDDATIRRQPLYAAGWLGGTILSLVTAFLAGWLI